MARRRRRNLAEARSLLGMHWDLVDRKITETLCTEIALLAPFPLTKEELIQGAVPQHIRDVLIGAKKYAQGYHSSLGNIHYGALLTFTVDFDCLKMMVPQRKYIELDDNARCHLSQWWDDVCPIYRKWQLVRYVANWFNNNATVGAVRYYWPSMLALLPESTTIFRELHSAGLEKYKEPTGVSKVLHLVRETAMTVAAGQLLPAQAGSTKVGLAATINSHSFLHNDAAEYVHEIFGTSVALELRK